MISFNAETKTVEIKGREYKVGYAKKEANGIWSLGVEGKRGAIYMTCLHPSGKFTKLVRV